MIPNFFIHDLSYNQIFEDSSTAHCALGEFLDDTSSATVACVFVDESGDSAIKKIDSYYLF